MNHLLRLKSKTKHSEKQNSLTSPDCDFTDAGKNVFSNRNKTQTKPTIQKWSDEHTLLSHSASATPIYDLDLKQFRLLLLQRSMLSLYN